MAGNGVYLNYLSVDVTLVFARSCAQHDRADERRDTADHMDRAGTGVIVEAEGGKPTAAPDPVRFDGVDKQGNDRGVDAVGGELSSLCHSTRNDGCRRRAEHEVEHEEGRVGEAVRRAGDKRLKVGKQVHVGQSDEPCEHVFAHHQRVAEEGKDHRADAEVHQVFHNDVTGVLGAGETRFHHSKSGLHPKYQRCADQKPKFNCHHNCFLL